METTKKSQIVGIKNAGIVIICCFIVAVCIFQFLLGNPSNFMNNDPNNHPLNMLGTIYKGGVIVPVIQTLLLTVLALSIERFFALRSAFGKGSLAKFVANIKDYFRYIDGIARYCNRYDPFICRIVCRWWCRLYGFVTRYFRSFD